MEAAAAEPAEAARQLPVLGERVRKTAEAGVRRRCGDEEDERAGQPDVDPQRPFDPERDVRPERVHDPHQRRAQPRRAELRRPVRRRKGRQPDQRDQHRHEDDGSDAEEEAPRQVASRPANLLGEVRDRLEPRVREERERQRERDLVPRGLRADVEPARERARREEEREAEQHEQQLRHEVEQRHDEAEGVKTRPPHQAHDRDRGDHDTADDHVARTLRDRVHADREAEVVREEERRERDHDQVVEEERPTGHEPGQVVERDADEGRGAARLSDRRRPLGVRHRHDEEEHADDREDERREPERMQRDDAEREVERGRHLAVRDGGERRRVQHALQPRQLAGHARNLPGEELRSSPEVRNSANGRARSPVGSVQ